MPLIKIFNYDTDSAVTYAFKMVKVKGCNIILVTPEEETINIYGRILEVKGLNV